MQDCPTRVMGKHRLAANCVWWYHWVTVLINIIITNLFMCVSRESLLPFSPKKEKETNFSTEFPCCSICTGVVRFSQFLTFKDSAVLMSKCSDIRPWKLQSYKIMKYELQTTKCEVWSVNCKVWTVNCVWSVKYKLHKQQTVKYELQSMNCEL